MILRLLIKILSPLFRGMHVMKADQFVKRPVSPGDVVFLGDSITEGGLWSEWIPGLPIRNRGIDGDTTQGVLDRLEVATGPSPAAVLLLIGTNDIASGVKRGMIAANVSTILSSIRSASPSTTLVLNSVMPRAKSYTKRVRELNVLLERIAGEHGATWIDLWPTLATPEGTLRPDVTEDRLHLNGTGYRLWVDQLTPELDRLR